MFLGQTLKRFLSLTLIFAITFATFGTAIAATDPNKAVFEFKLYEYNETTPDADNIGALGNELPKKDPNNSDSPYIINPGQKFVAKVFIKKFKKEFGFAGIEYSMGYDKSAVTLMTNHDTSSGDHPSNGANNTPTDFTEFQNKLWNKLNTNGKFSPSNTNYQMFNIVDSASPLTSVKQGQNEIRVYGVSNTKTGTTTIKPDDLFKGDTNDETVGVFLFQANNNSSPSSPNLPPLMIFDENGAIDFAWYNSTNPADTKNVIKGGTGDTNFDTVFNPPVVPPIEIPSESLYIKSVGPFVTSADDPKLTNVTNINELINVMLPKKVDLHRKDGSVTSLDPNWIQEGSDAFNSKGGTYTFQTNINENLLSGAKNLTNVQIIITPVYAKFPLDVRDTKILLTLEEKNKIDTFDKLSVKFPNASGKVLYEGSKFGTTEGPNYTLAYTPNNLPADWNNFTIGSSFEYTGTVAVAGNFPKWATVIQPGEIKVQVLIDDMVDIIVTPKPLPEYPDDPNTTEIDKFSGHMTSADDPEIQNLNTIEDFKNKYLPKLVEAYKLLPDGTYGFYGHVVANWTYKGNLAGDNNTTVNPKKESYRYQTNVEGVKEVNKQANAKIVITEVKGTLPVPTNMNLYFDSETVKNIKNINDLTALLQQPGNIKLEGAKSNTVLPYGITWNPNTLPADFQTASKTYIYTGTITDSKGNAFANPKWLTATIPASVTSNVEVNLDSNKKIVDIKDKTDRVEQTSADDDRINKAENISPIISLLPSTLTVVLADNSEKDVPANWIPLAGVDTVINLKGKTYNLKSNVSGIDTAKQINGRVNVTAVTASPNTDYKNGSMKFLQNKLHDINQIMTRLPQNSKFIQLTGALPTTKAPNYVIDWNLSNLNNLNTTVVGSKETVSGRINPLTALWLTYVDNGVNWTVEITDYPTIDLIGNTNKKNDPTDPTSSDVYMYGHRGYRDTGWVIKNPDGTLFTGSVSVVRKAYALDASGNKDASTEVTLPAYSKSEDTTIDKAKSNNYGKYIIEYKFTLDGVQHKDTQTRKVNIIYLRGDINKDGIVNGTSNDLDKNTDLGLFNLIIKRRVKYDNSSSDAKYIADLYSSYTRFTYPNANDLNGNVNMIFKVHNAERLEKYAKKISVTQQLFDFLVPGEDAYTNKYPAIP